eukprot:20047-Heterococcus_DN1.PRE.2
MLASSNYKAMQYAVHFCAYYASVALPAHMLMRSHSSDDAFLPTSTSVLLYITTTSLPEIYSAILVYADHCQHSGTDAVLNTT